MKAHKYITQISKQDLQELAALTNLEPGWLIQIDKSQDKIKIGINQKAFALAINGFFRNGGCDQNAANCTNVPFDPPS